jgi:hypothetical protein
MDVRTDPLKMGMGSVTLMADDSFAQKGGKCGSH